MTKAQQQQQQEARKNLLNFLQTHTPIIDGYYNIHADREHSKSGTSQTFNLYTISKNYQICTLNYMIHQSLGISMTRDLKRLYRKGGFTDLAHDTVCELASALNIPIRYVEH